MARIVSEEDIKRYEVLDRRAHEEILEKKIRRCLSIIDECHQITLWHKIKEKISGECKICKQLEGLK